LQTFVIRVVAESSQLAVEKEMTGNTVSDDEIAYACIEGKLHQDAVC
jgi:hypothetical protein